MARFFNRKPIELLAPAGNFEIFKEVIQLDCDAVYFGGKNLNMRLHRKDYNFSDAELEEAVKLAHSLGKKAYITVNNLYGDQELSELKSFLIKLEGYKPDALIVQDLSVIALIKELALELTVHASVMMNIHNQQSIYALKDLGVTRVVISREASLTYSKYLADTTQMEIEYFIHGDMCIAHGGQCLYSGILFGQSSNRGRCLKPCRWSFNIHQDGMDYQTEFPMAVKDMSMYEHIPELIEGGVTSFKIEGRMRDIGYLKMIIGTYADAIDRYIKDPICYDRKKDSELLKENRKRDTSPAYAFGRPGLSNINTRYEGTGTLFSSGKVFSTATEEREITEEKLEKITQELKSYSKNNTEKAKLKVKVNNITQAQICLEAGVDAIYLSGDVFLPDRPFSRYEIEELVSGKGNTEIYLGMPHMTFDMQFEQYGQLMASGLPVDGLLATNIGGIRTFKEKNLIGDYPLNILNYAAAGFYEKMGLNRFTITPEATLPEAMELINLAGSKAELIVYGSPTVMYMEHDLYDNVEKDREGLLYLVDEKGFKHPVYKDQYGRNHMVLYKNLCYLPILKGLYEGGLLNFRIEAAHLSKKELKHVITIYKKALSDLNNCNNLYHEIKTEGTGFTLGIFGL
ncbi:U32 family peptidase [Clostridium sp. KNHs205]|jgi:U32 family peptidase|uniref:U32 family peptidase n=1 Tax=Clostridium sp. KNHs205 TaxID=1449050 RepID=UPI00051BAFC1|nr:U32 family peptidase [Clostridium sp. KNHs205]